MPTYNYKCTECGKVFQKNRSMADMKKDIPCECGGISKHAFTVNKSPVIFKGSGWAGKSK